MSFSYQKSFIEPTQTVDRQTFTELFTSAQTRWLIEKHREVKADLDNTDRWLADKDFQEWLRRSRKMAGCAVEDQVKAWCNDLKKRLPAIMFQATFDETTSKNGYRGRWRKQSATRLTGLVVMDVDHVDDPREVHGSWLKVHDLKALGVLLVYVTPGGHGLKVVFKARTEWGNLIDNQRQMARLLRVEVDESCKDASRMSFVSRYEDILFINQEELFTYENKEFSENFTEEYRGGHSQPTLDFADNGNAADNNNSQCAAVPTAGADDKADGKGDGQDTGVAGGVDVSKWKGYDIQSFINARYGDKLPCKDDSNRHTESLKLATDLLIMLDGDKQQVERILLAQPWVKEIVKERNENVAQTVNSAAECVAGKEKKTSSPYPSAAMRTAIEKVTGKKYAEKVRETPDSAGGPAALPLTAWGAAIRQMGDTFPCLKEVCSDLSDEALPAALFASAAMMGTLMTRTWYHFYHRPQEDRRLNYCVYIIGDPGSGKSFVGDLYDVLMQPIIASDAIGYAALNEYKSQKDERSTSSKEQKKEKLEKPKPIIRIHPSRTSNGVFIADMNNAVDTVGQKMLHLHLFTFDAELDNNTALTSRGSGNWANKESLELKAFHNEEDGQAYQNLESYMGLFKVYWNFVYTGTILSLKRKCKEETGVSSGLSCRMAVLPMPSSNFQMMELKEPANDSAKDEVLAEWAERLDKVSGELPLWPLVKECWEWTRDRMTIAGMNDDKADELLIKRVAYYGINVSAPYILMHHWQQWQEKKTFDIDEEDLQLCRLVLDIQYQTQHFYFGEYARMYFDNQQRDINRNAGHRNKTRMAYVQLTDEFTSEDVERLTGASNGACRVLISRLIKDGKVTRVKTNTYKKIVKEL
jgi:hypothetical protein